MARGWESKSVEDQQDEAVRSRTSILNQTGPPIAREDAARRAELASLTLARTRAEHDLRSATAPAHRSMLEGAIAELSRQIANLS